MIRFRPLPGLTIATLIGVAILLGLGKWQLDRLHWKLGLIAAANSRAHEPPVPVETLVGRKPKDIEYTHAGAAGTFVPGDEIYLFSQISGGAVGYDVLQPLRLADGRALIVDRGFVPSTMDGKPAPFTAAPSGAVEITGLVRGTQKPGLFTPRAELAKKIFFVHDVPAIASAMGLSGELPFVLAADRTGPRGVYPEGGHTRLTFRNEHLQYAVTWFSLAAVLLIMFFFYHGKRGRLVLGPRQGPTPAP
jgi:surfeit locus 1 family protein